MTVFESLKTKNIDELARWINKKDTLSDYPWIRWFDKNYCRKCETVFAIVEPFDHECECAWCEAHKKCKYFQDMVDIPNNEEIIKLWLESEAEED